MDLLETSPSDWHFFAKGNANALFAYNGANPTFQNQLLRLRLEKPIDLYVSVKKLSDFIKGTCEPLFPGQIVGTQMVEMPQEFKEKLSTDCNLMEIEPHGFLMTNVRLGNYQSFKILKYCTIHVGQRSTKGGELNPDAKAFDNSNLTNSRSPSIEGTSLPVTSVLLEFKPKWLYEPNERYCRTCLLKQLKGHNRHFCSIDLVRDETMERGVTDLISGIPNQVQERLERDRFPLKESLLAFVLRPNNLLRTLFKHEAVADEDSILSLKNAEDVLDRLSLAMTLRDVGMFIKIEEVKQVSLKQILNLADGDVVFVISNGRKYELSAFIYDLDLKSSLRLSHWKAVEEQLQPFYNAKTDWPTCKR